MYVWASSMNFTKSYPSLPVKWEWYHLHRKCGLKDWDTMDKDVGLNTTVIKVFDFKVVLVFFSQPPSD